MAVGLITTPVQWLLRTIYTHTWGQNVQDNINNIYPFKSNERSFWMSPASCRFIGGTVVSGANSEGDAIWTTAASAYAQLSVPIFFYSATVGQKLTGIDVKVNQAGAAGMTVSLYEVDNMSGTSNPIDGTTLGSIVSSTTGAASSGIKTLSLSGLTRYQKPDVMLWLRITPVTNNDALYGVKFTFDQSAYV
jgi:hypothetical protein